MSSRVRFRAWPSDAGNPVEIRDVGARVSFTADALELAKQVASTDGSPIEIRDDGFDISEYQAWDHNGWGDGLPFYLSSLDVAYADGGSDYRAKHAATLEGYEEIEPLPVESFPGLDQRIELPDPNAQTPSPFGDTLRSRRTTLVPQRSPLAIGALATILSEATARLAAFRVPDIGSDFRSAMVNFGPSLDIYVVVYEVEGLESGAYRYDPSKRELYCLSLGDLRAPMRVALVGQPAPLTSAVTVIYASEVQRHQWRYRHARALRGLWIDSAKVVNHLLWALAARQIVPHMSPAVADTEICRLLSLDPNLDNEIVYSVSFGGPASGATSA